jgi:hypothetical protein
MPHFPHSDFERHRVHETAHAAIDSHNKEEYLWSEEERKVRTEHPGITLDGPELAVVKSVIFDWMSATKNEVTELESSLREPGGAFNRSETEEKLNNLRRRLNFLEHNLAEKLFDETKDITKH